MLVAQRRSNRSQHSNTKSVPAPIGGWNTRDPVASMPAEDAISLDNWFCRTGDVTIRRGCIDWTTGLPGQVNSLLVYAAARNTKMFAVSGGGLYDVTARGVVGAALMTGITNSKFKSVNMSTPGGRFLWAVNGADLAVLYDGTSWTHPNVTFAGSQTTANMSNISIWKNRIFLTQNDSLSIWYLPISSIGGTASELNLGPIFRLGGRIVATTSWTLDGGYGMDDHLVIMTSKGEVAVYRGTDPSNANNFALIGIYELGSPIGDKCATKFGGDLILLTLDGFEPLSTSLTSTRINNSIALSKKISGAATDSTSAYQNNFGWEIILYPTENMLIVNVPVTEGVESHQYVMNTITGAWSRFKGWNANTFALVNDELYFATNHKVCKAWQNNDDSGVAITTLAKTAFNYFDASAREKQWKMVRPLFTASLKPVISIGLNVDFEDIEAANSVSFSGLDNTWDNGLWDFNYWSGPGIFKDWQTVFGVGYCAALRLQTSLIGLDLAWSATDFVYEYGGTI